MIFVIDRRDKKKNGGEKWTMRKILKKILGAEIWPKMIQRRLEKNKARRSNVSDGIFSEICCDNE